MVNKSDVGDREVWDYCQSKNIPVLMEIPMDRRIAESYSRGVPIVVEHPSYMQGFKDLFEKMEKLYESNRRRPRIE
jgi:MinD superfamily P-loop ATPase